MNPPSPSHPLSKRATSALCPRRPRRPRRPPTPSRCVGQVSGVNFYGELGIGKRTPVYTPALHKYWKLGDALYDQAVGGGRGFKNLSLVVFGFEHGFGMDEQGVLYAWGRNAYGQLGIQSREFPEGSRYHSLWPQPLPFFRPARLRLHRPRGPAPRRTHQSPRIDPGDGCAGFVQPDRRLRHLHGHLRG